MCRPNHEHPRNTVCAMFESAHTPCRQSARKTDSRHAERSSLSGQRPRMHSAEVAGDARLQFVFRGGIKPPGNGGPADVQPSIPPSATIRLDRGRAAVTLDTLSLRAAPCQPISILLKKRATGGSSASANRATGKTLLDKPAVAPDNRVNSDALEQAVNIPSFGRNHPPTISKIASISTAAPVGRAAKPRRASGVVPVCLFAVQLVQQIRSTINHQVLVGEFQRRIHAAQQFDDLQTVQRAVMAPHGIEDFDRRSLWRPHIPVRRSIRPPACP